MDQVRAVLLRGEFGRYSGFSRFAREMAFAIDDLGVPVQIENIGAIDPAFAAQPAFARLQGLAQPVDARFLVNITGPTLSRIDPTRINVLFPLFEATRVPPAWKHIADRADVVATSCLAAREAWLAEGVPAEKLRDCPLGIDPEPYLAVTPLDELMGLPVRGRPFGDHAVRMLNVGDVYGGFRKHPAGLLAAWIAATSADDDAVLALKWSLWRGPDAVQTFFRDVLARVEALVGKSVEDAAPIVLLTETVPDDVMARVFASGTHYISVSSGEGWDVPMMEAGAAGLRLIAPGHSSYRAYLNDTIATLLPWRAAPVLTGGWAEPVQAEFAGASGWSVDLDAAAGAIRAAIRGEDRYKPLARETICRDFTWRRAAEQLVRILEGALPIAVTHQVHRAVHEAAPERAPDVRDAAVQQAMEHPDTAGTLAVIERLKVWKPSSPRIRLGGAHDGGYVLTHSLIAAPTKLISIGLNDDSRFEEDWILLTGRPIEMYDGSCDCPGICTRWPGRFDHLLTYTRKFVGSEEGMAPIEEVLSDSDGALLKLDAENAEFDLLESVELGQLAGILLEVHLWHDEHLDGRFVAMLDKLNRDFALVHIHGNDNMGAFPLPPHLQLGGDGLPEVLELSFVNKALQSGMPELEGTSFPIPEVDASNVWGRRQLQLQGVNQPTGLPVRAVEHPVSEAAVGVDSDPPV